MRVLVRGAQVRRTFCNLPSGNKRDHSAPMRANSGNARYFLPSELGPRPFQGPEWLDRPVLWVKRRFLGRWKRSPSYTASTIALLPVHRIVASGTSILKINGRSRIPGIGGEFDQLLSILQWSSPRLFEYMFARLQ